MQVHARSTHRRDSERFAGGLLGDYKATQAQALAQAVAATLSRILPGEGPLKPGGA